MVYDPHLEIEAFGYHQARQRAANKDQRNAVEIAESMLEEVQLNIGLAHSGFALTSLPYRRPNHNVWRKEGHNIVLTIQSGLDHNAKSIGIPYGPVARLILIYLQTQAVQKRTRTVELGRSMRAWMKRMGVQDGGQNYRAIASQSERISACTLAFHYDVHAHEKPPRRNARFVEDHLPISVQLQDDRQPTLWTETVTLDERFYEEITKHAFPFRDDAIKHINHNALAIDLYIWLTYRLRYLSKPTFIPWAALHHQFGSEYTRVRDFKIRLRNTMPLVLAAYEEARVAEENGGMMLYPSPPPVRERSVATNRRLR